MTAVATQSGPVRWMRRYETVYVLRPDVSKEEAEKVAERLREIVERFDGKLTLVDNWGKRRTSYVIRHMGKKYTRGIYVLVQYVGAGGLVQELERHFRMLDEVMRFLTVKLEDMVDPATVEVDPEDLAFLPVEDEGDDEEPEMPHRLAVLAAAGVTVDQLKAQAEAEAAEAEAEAEAEAAEGESGDQDAEAGEAEGGEAAQAEGDSEEGA